MVRKSKAQAYVNTVSKGGAAASAAGAAFVENLVKNYLFKEAESRVLKGLQNVSMKNEYRGTGSRTQTATQENKKSRKDIYRTRGTLQGELPVKRKNPNMFFPNNGVVSRQESGGVVTDANAVYIGHSTNPHLEVTRNVFRAIVKSLFRIGGRDVASFDAIPESTLGIVFNYTYRDPNTTTTWSQRQWLAPANASYEGIALGLLLDIQALLSVFTPYEFGEINMRYHPVVSGDTFVQSSIDLRQYMLYFDIKSTLKVQNETLASTSEGDPNQDEIDNISNNPLQGMIYNNQGKWKNYIQYRDGLTRNNVSTLPVCIANHDTGRIQFTASSVNTNNLKKPPLKGYYFDCKNQGLVKLDPGAIKYSNLTFKCNMYFNTFVVKFTDSLTDLTKDWKIEFGNCALIGLEKSLAGRQAYQAPVRIAYQIDNTCKVAGKYLKKPATAEIVTVL